MTQYRYPADDLDEPRRVLALLGGFWQYVYAGRELVADVVETTLRAAKQRQLDFLELLGSVSRFELPVLHRENWELFTFRESDVNSATVRTAQYDDAGKLTYDEAATTLYGVPSRTLRNFSVTAPETLRNVKLILNRTLQPSLVWTRHVDFELSDGQLTFRTDPFQNPLVAKRELFEDGVAVDREAGLWLFHGDWDRQTLNEQFAYALKLTLESTEASKNLLNALLDGLAAGTTMRDIHFAWSALTGVPLIVEPEETVEEVVEEGDRLLIVTDQHVYDFPAGSTALVAAGDVRRAGDLLVDTLRFFDFHRGTIPVEVASLTLGHEFLGAGYYSGLTFHDRDVPLQSSVVAGRTRVEFSLDGFPGDVERFWDEVHARGIAGDASLANLLDVRPDPPNEPAPENLPATINPLGFLCENLLRFHFWGVAVKASRLSAGRVGLHLAGQLKRIVPPHTAMLVLLQLEQAESLDILENGDGSVPGYAEILATFPMLVTTDGIAATDVAERVVLKRLQGHCE